MTSRLCEWEPLSEHVLTARDSAPGGWLWLERSLGRVWGQADQGPGKMPDGQGPGPDSTPAECPPTPRMGAAFTHC